MAPSGRSFGKRPSSDRNSLRGMTRHDRAIEADGRTCAKLNHHKAIKPSSRERILAPAPRLCPRLSPPRLIEYAQDGGAKTGQTGMTASRLITFHRNLLALLIAFAIGTGAAF